MTGALTFRISAAGVNFCEGNTYDDTRAKGKLQTQDDEGRPLIGPKGLQDRLVAVPGGGLA